MQDLGTISIITPSFNRADIIHETAQSIFNQTYPYWEWVIVDDGSTDNSWEVINEFAAKDPRVKIYKRDREPKGACSCRNIAIERSTGSYLLFLDSDDLLASFCLEQRINAAHRYPESDFVIFSMLLFRQRPDDLALLWNIDKENDDVDRLLFGDAVCQGTGTLWKKRSFVEIGMWDEHLLLWQDVELHLRALIGGLKYTKQLQLKPDVFIRISDVSISRTGYHSLPKLNSRINVLQNTTQKMVDKGLLNRYRKGIRKMFIDLFINAGSINNTDIIRKLFNFSKNHQLFSGQEERKLKRFFIMRKYKLYKVPKVNSYCLNDIQKIELPAVTQTLGTLTYKEPIKL
jgi:glycosyltransferase involved in cell wall biosynthesis